MPKAQFLFAFEVWVGNYGYSFAVEFLKLLVLTCLFIMKCNLCKEIIYKRNVMSIFCSKKKCTHLKKIYIIKKFKIYKFYKKFHVFFIKVLNIKLADQNRNVCIFYKKKFQN